MRKIIPTILLSIFVLVSCNLPFSNSTPDANLVATLVAQTLAVNPTTGAQPTQSTLLTIALNTLAPSATPTITLTPTTPPGDPKLTLGSPSFLDTFTSKGSFGLNEPYEDEAIIINVENGTMVFQSKQVKGGRRWRLTSRNPRNLYLEGTFKTVTCTGYDNYGLVFRAPSYSDGVGYYFGLTCDGKYFFDRWVGSDVITVIDSTSDSHIIAGSGQTNRIGVMAQDANFKLYINGQLVKEFTDSGISAKGYIGAFASARENAGFTVNLEEIAVWALP